MNNMSNFELHSSNLLHALLSIHRSKPITISTQSSSIPNTPHSTRPNTPNSRRSINFGRRASVAIIIRISPNQSSPISTVQNSPTSSPIFSPPIQPNQPVDHSRQIKDFLSLPWVQNGSPEIFFIERTHRTSDRWSAHLAFPGGRMEPDDEDGLFCAMRETWEEVGIDLSEKGFLQLGRLDDREITTSLGKRLLMVLSPYVFLYTGSNGPPIPMLESSDVTAAYWVPLKTLSGPNTNWGEMTIDLSTRLAPSRGPFIRFLLRSLVGSMRFRSIILSHNPTTQISRSDQNQEAPPNLNLWGLTLGMTLDLISFFRSDMKPIPSTSSQDQPSFFRSPSLDHLNAPPPEITLVSPSITSIFPRFTHPDINALIWLLGRRYRNLIKLSQQQPYRTLQTSEAQKITKEVKDGTGSQTDSGFEESKSGLTTPSHQQKITINYLNNQVSWTSLTMKEFYRSVRKALILSVLFRTLSFSFSFGFLGFYWGPKAFLKIRSNFQLWLKHPMALISILKNKYRV